MADDINRTNWPEYQMEAGDSHRRQTSDNSGHHQQQQQQQHHQQQQQQHQVSFEVWLS